MISKNIAKIKKVRMSPWRKISLGTWRVSGDSSVYGMVELDAGPALAMVREYNDRGEKLTLTHLAAKAVAKTIQENPVINRVVRWGQLWQREDVDVFLHVAVDEEGEDLTGIVLRGLDKKPLAEAMAEVNQRARRLRAEGDPHFNKIKSVVGFVPTMLLRYVLDGIGFVLFNLNLWSPALNVERDPFGSVMVTSIGSLGAEFAFTPIPYYSRVPLIVAVGAARPGAVVDEATGQLRVGQRIKFGVTFDHRVIDGVHASKMAKSFRRHFENPAGLV